ncbi:MAG: hypothetical protein BWX86_00225 [Verrucomicrobia bacterium ADurb.Bin122]|nr:MAG: hypothetical protein BWX86_00225 [Verrucomicrobia bacterium ADurb.Bin122]
MAALSDAVGFDAAVRALRDSLKKSDPNIFGTWKDDQFRRYLVQYMAAAKQFGAGVSLNPLPGKPSWNAFVSVLQNGLGAPAETAKRFLAGIVRLYAAGAISFEVFSPALTEQRVAREKADAAADPGILDRLKSAGDKASAIVEYMPWILGGTAAVVLVFVAFPYLQAARAPAKLATR